MLLRSVLKLSSAVMLAQFVPFLAIPFIANHVEPSAFGYLGSFVAIISVVSVISTLRLEPAIVLEPSGGDALSKNIRTICFYSSILFGCFSYIVCFLFGLDMELSILFFISIYCYSVNKVVIQSLNSKKKYNQISVVNIVLAIAINFSHILATSVLGFKEESVLLYSYTCGIVISHFISLYIANFSMFPSIKVFKFPYVLKYWRFVKFELPSDLIFQASQYFPVVLISAAYGAQSAGLFSIAEKFVMIPVTFVAAALGTVLFKEYSDESPDISRRSEKIYYVLLIMSVLGVLLYLQFAEDFVALIFDASYTGVTDVANYLLCYAVLIFLSSPFSSMLWKVGKQNINLTLSVLTVLIRVVLFYSATNYLEFSEALLYLGVASLAPRLLLQGFCFYFLEFKILKILFILGVEMVVFASLIVVVLL